MSTEASTILDLPSDWDDNETGFTPVAEGDYTVVVYKAVQEEGERVKVELIIQGDGAFSKRHLFANYQLSTPAGKRLFKDFLHAISVKPCQNRVDLTACQNRSMAVTVRHTTRDGGKVYANVVSSARVTD